MKVSFAGVERQELREAADVCVRAYENYEYVTNFFPNKEESKRVLSSMIYHMGRAFFKKSHLFIAKVDGKIVGVAMFDNPEYKKPSTLQFILHGWLNVYRVADKKRLREYMAMDEAASKKHIGEVSNSKAEEDLEKEIDLIFKRFGTFCPTTIDFGYLYHNKYNTMDAINKVTAHTPLHS